MGMKPGVELEGKCVLVVGLARTGVATALFCAARGAQVTAVEQRAEAAEEPDAGVLRLAGVRLEFGPHSDELFLKQDLIVPSPGVPANLPALTVAIARGIHVWSEIELAWRFLRGRLIAITGSNGKTTTTALTGHILRTAGLPVLVGGNIGSPLISLSDASRDASVTVAEVSSFQMEWIEAFRPDIAVLLNVTPDHLDRHGSLENYARVKARIFSNQRPEDTAVLNGDDSLVGELVPEYPRVFWFSRRRRVAAGAFAVNGDVVFRRDGKDEILFARADIPIRGAHNVENVLAACTVARLAGASIEAIGQGVRTFGGVEHRLEFVDEIAGVKFYNDSKATNVDATLKALDAFDGPLTVILGGRGKNTDYAPLSTALSRPDRRVLLIGEEAGKLASALGADVAFEQAGTLERALDRAFAMAQPGESVLLAPACASFDQFRNFEHRGECFKAWVAELGRREVIQPQCKK
jgi:UDP-N-acetylmuramoylalanine--D-glutamate ligase